jgi:DNA-binding MarR family transcriptional regulator
MTSTTPLSAPQTTQALEQDLGWSLRTLSMEFQTRATRAVAGLPGGPRGYLVLMAVSGEDAPSQLSLAQTLSTDRTQMTYLLDELQKEGLIERIPGETDRRVRLIRLTDAGRSTMTQTRTAVEAAEHQVLAELNPEEQATLRALLSRAAGAASAQPHPERSR